MSTWESRGADIRIRPANQAALDTSLIRSPADVHARFDTLLTDVAPSNGTRLVSSVPQPPVPQDVFSGPRIVKHPADGREMAVVEAGVFRTGVDDIPTRLPEFLIDVRPVTNADYERFVADAGHPPPQHWTGHTPPLSLRDHPVVYVTWHDANAYARWAGKRLPTAHEWEKTARGPQGDTYPWGDQPTPAKCNSRESGIRSTTPVNRYHSGVSSYGVYDLCGNTWEWTSTESEAGRYELKGGAWTSPFTRTAPATFNDADATMLDDDTGFRCATSPTDARYAARVLSPARI
ncbi:formylglycine-generating enzyme family protein [Myceligenerans cantabricum]